MKKQFLAAILCLNSFLTIGFTGESNRPRPFSDLKVLMAGKKLDHLKQLPTFLCFYRGRDVNWDNQQKLLITEHLEKHDCKEFLPEKLVHDFALITGHSRQIFTGHIRETQTTEYAFNENDIRVAAISENTIYSLCSGDESGQCHFEYNSKFQIIQEEQAKRTYIASRKIVDSRGRAQGDLISSALSESDAIRKLELLKTADKHLFFQSDSQIEWPMR